MQVFKWGIFMKWRLLSIVLFNLLVFQNSIVGSEANQIIGFGMEFRPYSYAELIPAISSINITARALYNGQRKQARVRISGDLTDHVSIMCDIQDDNAEGGWAEVHMGSIYVRKENFPKLFAELADFNTWFSTFYYRYTFDWDKVEKKERRQFRVIMNYFEMYKNNVQDKPIDTKIEQQLYSIYQMAMAIMRLIGGVYITVPNNPYEADFFEWDVLPQGNVLPSTQQLHLVYFPNTSLGEISRLFRRKITLTHEPVDTRDDTPQEFKLNEYAITIMRNGMVLSNDAIMPNLKGNKNSGYALEIKQSLLYYEKDKLNGSITLRYTNPSDVWIKDKKVGKIELVMSIRASQKKYKDLRDMQKSDRGLIELDDAHFTTMLDDAEFQITLKAWDINGNTLSDLKDPAIITADDIKTNWEYTYPDGLYVTLIQRLILTPYKAAVNNEYWVESKYKYSLEDLCQRAIRLYAAKKNLPVMIDGFPQKEQPQTSWISNKYVIGLGLGALAYMYSSHKR